MSGPLQFSFDDADLDAVLTGASPAEDGRVAASEELTGLSRRIAGQYADVVAAFASQAFGAPSREAAIQQVRSAIGALRRLSTATGDVDLLGALGVLDGVLGSAGERGVRARQRFLRELHDAILGLAERLDDADASRLRAIVTFDRKALPLLDELANLPGIGPRRLDRLYCAGLFTVEAVSVAHPDEIAQVTGLPRPLARRVVEATGDFAREQRRRCAIALHQRAMELNVVLEGLPLDADARREVLGLTRTALAELQTALARMGAQEDS